MNHTTDLQQFIYGLCVFAFGFWFVVGMLIAQINRREKR